MRPAHTSTIACRLRSNKCATLLNYNICKMCLPWRLHIIALVSHVYVPNSIFTACLCFGWLPPYNSTYEYFFFFFSGGIWVWRRRKTNPPIPTFTIRSHLYVLCSYSQTTESHHRRYSQTKMLNTSANAIKEKICFYSFYKLLFRAKNLWFYTLLETPLTRMGKPL